METLLDVSRTLHLPIRNCRVTGSSGEVAHRATVYCPVHGASVGLDRCAQCDACEAFPIEPTGNGAVMACRVPSRILPTAAPPVATVADVMTKCVDCLESDVSLVAAEAYLLRHHIGGAPVVDKDRRPIGVLSRSDLLQPRRAVARTVDDVMTRMAFTVHEGTALASAAALLVFENIHRVPVVCSEGRVVGILSTFDITRWVAESHGYVIH